MHSLELYKVFCMAEHRPWALGRRGEGWGRYERSGAERMGSEGAETVFFKQQVQGLKDREGCGHFWGLEKAQESWNQGKAGSTRLAEGSVCLQLGKP